LSADGVFIHRLVFAVRYAEFHQKRLEGDLQDAALDLVSIFQGDIAPKSWWGVLLTDSVDLLNCGKYGLCLAYRRPGLTQSAADAMHFSTAGACELLHRLEEVQMRASQGSGQDYLSVLVKVVRVGSEQEALLRLRIVRVALARYLARCAVIDVGGKDAFGVPSRFSGRAHGGVAHAIV
jgi:nuclear pore complex protein Nup85